MWNYRHDYKWELPNVSASSATMNGFYILLALVVIFTQSSNASFDHDHFGDFDHFDHGHGLSHHFPFHSFWGGFGHLGDDVFPFKNRKHAARKNIKHKKANKNKH
ncbi:hypothetical protein RB195_005808 [Necator americanus]|uniref:Uncharacterized protein n=1 Tax=Necator americanus TaxID=51031 RepID=A0ABR1BT14_NECAM